MVTKSEAVSKLKELSEIITKSREAYFNFNQSDITDLEYDQKISEFGKIIAKYPELEDEYKVLDQIGATPNSKFKKVKHLTPMYSLSNAFSKEDIYNFLKQIRSFLDLSESENIDLVFEPKIDGLSLSLIYKNGKFEKGLSRGDGKEGEDITNNLKTISDIPHYINSKDFPEEIDIRGEVFIKNSDFKGLNEKFANPRNAASGSLRQKNPEDTKKIPLNFIAYTFGFEKGLLVRNQSDFINKLISHTANVKFDIYGLNKAQPIWADHYFKTISNSKMGLNLSRGEPIKYYSSDRITQIIGNGLVTLIDEKTQYSDFFNNKEMVFYKNINDLSEKIMKISRDEKLRKQIAKNGKDKYMKYFNSNLVADFIIKKTLSLKDKTKYLWHKP